MRVPGPAAQAHSLVEVGLLGHLLAPLQGIGVLVLQTLQVRHGPHTLDLQPLIVRIQSVVGPGPKSKWPREHRPQESHCLGASASHLLVLVKLSYPSSPDQLKQGPSDGSSLDSLSVSLLESQEAAALLSRRFQESGSTSNL